MDLTDLARRWTEAWRAGDPAAVAAVVAAFTDPDTDGEVRGPDLAAHLDTTLTRFGDLVLDFAEPVVAGDTVVLNWKLTAAHRAAYLGVPAVGDPVSVDGVDILTAGAAGPTARRHFDRLALVESVGYTAHFVPARDEVREYGTSNRMSTGRPVNPGVLSLTWLDSRDLEEAAEVDLLGVEVIRSMAASRGFLGAGAFTIGTRKYTLAAFDRMESVRAVHARPHQRALRRFFRSGLCTGAYTSVWSLERDSLYIRCAGCGSMAAAGGACDCGDTTAADVLF